MGHRVLLPVTEAVVWSAGVQAVVVLPTTAVPTTPVVVVEGWTGPDG
jgi:hypothetical protein